MSGTPGDAAHRDDAVLSPRQETILRAVVERFVATGQPVASKHLARSGGIAASPSTVRNELARLEDRGFLRHPHTSAGRVPTDAGYRYYVDEMLPSLPAPSPGVALRAALQPGAMRAEVTDALQRLADDISRATELLGVVTAPAAPSATVRHVEVLRLQPTAVMVVVITSTGDVRKRIHTFSRPVDPGLCDWARAFLNERAEGYPVGGGTLEGRLRDPSLSVTERAFVDSIAPALLDPDTASAEALFVGGRARLLSGHRTDVDVIDALMERLEERYALLALLRGALTRHEVYLRIGRELPEPELQGLAMVAANYGVPRRNLGTVSLFGPTRMDYPLAVATVRDAAAALSRYLEDVYE